MQVLGVSVERWRTILEACLRPRTLAHLYLKLDAIAKDALSIKRGSAGLEIPNTVVRGFIHDDPKSIPSILDSVSRYIRLRSDFRAFLNTKKTKDRES